MIKQAYLRGLQKSAFVDQALGALQVAEVAQAVAEAPRAVNVPYTAGWLGTVILDLASKINSVAGGISGALLTRPALGAPRNLLPPFIPELPFPIPRAAVVAGGQLGLSPVGIAANLKSL